MNQTLAYIVALVIGIMICGIGLFIFYHKWEGFMKTVLKTAREVKTELGDELEKTEKFAPEDKPREPLTRERLKQNFAMPVLFIVMFPAIYLPLQWFLNSSKDNFTQGSMFICVMVIGVLIALVFSALGQQEKNPRRKFWLELIPTLGLELMLAFDVYFLLSGYYAERELRGVKSMFYFLVIGIPWFLSYAGKTQRNWKRMIAPEKVAE